MLRVPDENQANRLAQLESQLARAGEGLNDEAKKKNEPYKKALAERDNFLKSIPTVLATVSTKPQETRILPRGNWMDKTGDVVQPDVPGFLKMAPLAARSANRSGRVAGGPRQSADRPGVRQPALETLLWTRVVRSARRRWFSGRTPDASRAARLVGGGIHGVRLEHQARGSPDHHVEHLPTVIATRGTTRIARPVQPAGRSAGPIPAGRRVGPRQRARRQRAAFPANWRPQRQAVPTGRLLGQPAFPQAHLQT